MNRLYTFYPVFDEEDYVLWIVHETGTGQIIDEFVFEEDAHEYCHFLENGGGFAGFTPAFMLNKMPSVDINTAFESL